MEKIVWISGWSLSDSWLRDLVTAKFPNYEHLCFYPSASTINEVTKTEYNHLIGISLGAALILDSMKKLGSPEKISLITPFLDFKSESNLGGKTSIKQLNLLLRVLKLNPLQAVNNFYKQIGIPDHLNELPYPQNDLIWGINFLLNYSCTSYDFNFKQALFGENDPLIDSKFLAKLIPNSIIIKDLKHNIHNFLQYIKF